MSVRVLVWMCTHDPFVAASIDGVTGEVFRQRLSPDHRQIESRDPAAVTGVSTAEYFAEKVVASRPLRSVLDLSKLRLAGFVPKDANVALRKYLEADGVTSIDSRSAMNDLVAR